MKLVNATEAFEAEKVVLMEKVAKLESTEEQFLTAKEKFEELEVKFKDYQVSLIFWLSVDAVTVVLFVVVLCSLIQMTSMQLCVPTNGWSLDCFIYRNVLVRRMLPS